MSQKTSHIHRCLDCDTVYSVGNVPKKACTLCHGTVIREDPHNPL